MLKVVTALAVGLAAVCALPRPAHAAPCPLDDAARDTDACVTRDKIELDNLRLEAHQVVEAAEKSAGEAAREAFVEGGQRYLDAYRTYCERPIQEGRSRHVEARTCEEICFNAARAFGAARVTAKALAAYRLLVAEEQRSGVGSPLTARAVYEIGAAYRAMGLFEEAAEWLERFSTRQPAHDMAPAALTDAALLRLGLGQDVQAAADVATFTRTWGITRRAEAAQLSLALAAQHVKHGEDDKARAVLGAAMPMLDRGPPDLVVRAHALAAKVAPTRAVARAEWAKVRAAWSDPAAAERAMRRGWPADDEQRGDRRLARALTAVGEAMVAAADELRAVEVDPIKLAPLSGAADAAAIATYGNTTLRAFLVKKREAIERAEAAYRSVLEIRPVPPPLSVVAASAAVGAMWGDFADELRHVPIPKAVRNDPAVARAYLEAVDGASDPIRNGRAKPAMKACLSYAAKYQVFDPRTRRCEAWLVKHTTDVHPVDELVPGVRAPALLDGRASSPPLRGSPTLDP